MRVDGIALLVTAGALGAGAAVFAHNRGIASLAAHLAFGVAIGIAGTVLALVATENRKPTSTGGPSRDDEP